MTLNDLIATARLRAADTIGNPYLWSDDEWMAFANDAEREACRRARLITDSSTAEVCSITLSATVATYDLDPRILFIQRAKLVGRSQPLGRASFKDLDRSAPDWEGETGEPRAYVPDMDTGLFRPYPTPDSTGQVRLTVTRLPLDDMTDGSNTPEIRPHLHDSLVHWMLYRAYSKQDSEVADPNKAAGYLTLFEQEFGKKSSAIDEAWIAREHGYTEDEGVY